MNMFDLQPVDHSFIDTANLCVTTTVRAKCTPEQIFETLRGDKVWTEWGVALKEVQWTCEKPYGLGSTRTVYLMGGMAVEEVFFHWHENQRCTFYVKRGSIPNVISFLEDYIVTPLDNGETELQWTVAMEMGGIAKWFIPLSRLFMKITFKNWLGRYKKILEAM